MHCCSIERVKVELKSVGQNDINDSHQPSQLSHRFDIVQDFYGDPGDQRRREWPFVGTRLGRSDVATEIVTWEQAKDESYRGI